MAVVGFTAIGFSGTSVGAAETESVNARGILAQPGTILLFTEVHSCGSETILPAAQLFVSHDEGRTWTKTGPSIDRGEFEYALAASDGLWIAGLLTAEGPGTSPFILVPASKAGEQEWSEQTIYDGPSELRGLARTAEIFLARIKHLDLRDERKSALVIHRSTDGGHTWAAIDPSIAKQMKAPQKFEPVAKRIGRWRVIDRRDGGFTVQHQDKGRWRAVAEFPWHPCDR